MIKILALLGIAIMFATITGVCVHAAIPYLDPR
jgi:hypothetical protein